MLREWSRPRARPVVPLWVLMLLVLGTMVVYVAGIAGYVALGVVPTAAELRRHSVPVQRLFDSVMVRSARLDDAAAQARMLVQELPAVNAAHLGALAALRDAATPRTDMTPFAVGIPSDMWGPLARSDDEASSLAARLVEVASLVELGRYAEAERRLQAVDSVQRRLVAAVAEAQRLGVAHLVEHERVVEGKIAVAQRWLMVWTVLGLILLPLAYLLLRRRLVGPLAELERGLGALARGDLGVQITPGPPDEVGRLAIHFNEMTQVLRQRAEEQGRFAAAGELLAGVAHEVNNPLMAIAGLAESHRDEPSLPPALRGDFDQIVRQARRAGRLLSGLLRFVRPAAVETELVDLNAVLRSAADLVSFQFPVNEIVLESRLDPSLPAVLGSSARFEQVFVNLLANAVDALRQAPHPRRIVAESGVADDRVYLAISDTGPGIAPEIAARLFLPFVSTKGEAGTGLGLYISRQIVRGMGGDLVLEPGEGGARFVVRVPPAADIPHFAPAMRTAPAVPRGADGSLDGLTVLIVDDEPAVRRPIARYVARVGARVLEAADGAHALEILDATPVDVIVADVRMPRMDGLTFYREVEGSRRELARRIVFLSGDLSQLEHEGSMPVPPERVLVKPVELPVLRAKLLEVARATLAATPAEASVTNSPAD